MLNKANKERGTAFFLVKMIIVLIVGFGGYYFSNFLMTKGLFTAPINLLYMTLVGLMLGYILGTPIASYFEFLWTKFRSYMATISPLSILAAGLGLTVALIISVLLNTLLENIPGFTWYWSLILTVLLASGSMWFFTANKKLLAGFSSNTVVKEIEKPKKLNQELVIDTSAIIDGRIADVVETDFLFGKIIVPKFILAELQNIADSSDNLRRTKGRRGLEILDKLIQQNKIETEVVNDDFAEVNEVDEKLVQLCQVRGAALITTDYNLNRVAGLQNIKVLNINQLANAIRPVFLPGESLALYIVKSGREPGQGLAYLDDGTMVVVEDSANLVGSTVDAVVTSHLQTNMGRIIFARPD